MNIHNLPKDILCRIMNSLDLKLENSFNWLSIMQNIVISHKKFKFIAYEICKISNKNLTDLEKTLYDIYNPLKKNSPFKKLLNRKSINEECLLKKSFIASNLWCYICYKKLDNYSVDCVKLVYIKDYNGNKLYTFRKKNTFTKYNGDNNGIITLDKSEFIIIWVGYGKDIKNKMIYGIEQEELAYINHNKFY